MTTPDIASIVLLSGLFLLIVALLVWQEVRSRAVIEAPVYVIEDAVSFVCDRLPDVSTNLSRSDVLRILEYEIFYLQGLAQDDRRAVVETVAGGVDSSVDFIAGQIAQRHNAIYSRSDIEAVLSLEADYLRHIGAVGEPVESQEEERS